MKKFTPQTKSFIILFVIAFIGTYFCLILANRQQNSQENNQANKQGYSVVTYEQNSDLIKNASAAQDPVVDTADWKTYTDDKYDFSFKYDPTWQVKPAVKKGDYYLIEVDPGKKFYNIQIYISEKGFYAMDSLPMKEETIAGKTAQNVSNMLYGIKNGQYYYTFDVGLSVSLRPDFNALVRSVSFIE